MFSTAYRNYVLAVMTTVYLFNLVDRGLMMLLLQPIKTDLHLSDTQLGFLTGIAFALFYSTVGVPMARWADRGDRVTITSIAIGLWGITVMACVFVTNFAQLLIARIAAAVGEAGGMPPTYSLLGDYFPEPATRSRAMGIYVSGGTLSALLSLIGGGWLSEQFGWRVAFFVMGVPGLILAVLVKKTVMETRTNLGNGLALQRRPAPPMRAVLAVLWHQQSCRHMSIALVVLYFVSLGLSPWYAAFMIRSHGMGTTELGVWLGLIVGLGGTAGVLLGGYAAAKWFARNERGQLIMISVGVASLVPCLVAFLTFRQKQHALIALIPLVMAFNFFYGPIFALMQRLVPDEMRATMLAVVMLLANLIGMGIGPQIVGILSDALTAKLGGDSLRFAMLTVSFVAFWGAYHFWRVSRTINEDLAIVAERISANWDRSGCNDSGQATSCAKTMET